MARIRTIKPELPSDPSLAACSRDARLCFTYLITQSDDYGYVPAAPRQIVGLLFPHDADIAPAQVGAWINELVAVGLCAWAWTTDGLPLVRLLGWEQHQRIDNRRKPVLSARLQADKTTPPPYASPEFAAVRGGSRRTRGKSRLEPPTSDLRPTTSDLRAHPDAADQLTTTPLPAEPPPAVRTSVNWPASIAAAWCRLIGPRSPGRIGSDLKLFVAQYPDPVAAERALLAAVDNFAKHRRLALERGEHRPDNWPQFVRDLLDYVPPPLRPERAA